MSGRLLILFVSSSGQVSVVILSTTSMASDTSMVRGDEETFGDTKSALGEICVTIDRSGPKSQLE